MRRKLRRGAARTARGRAGVRAALGVAGLAVAGVAEYEIHAALNEPVRRHLVGSEANLARPVDGGDGGSPRGALSRPDL